jgi:hypothetical protein
VKIQRITAQKRPLEDHFNELAALGADNKYSRIGRRMLELLVQLREVDGPAVWAVTSHANLILVAGDDYRLPWLVTVRCDGDWFEVEYVMPPGEAPRPGACVLSRTGDPVQACKMVVFGLSKATGATNTDR